MAIHRVVCANPRCQRILRIRTEQAGRRIRCPACKIALIAPGLADGSADPGQDDPSAEDAEFDAPVPLWMTLFFWLLALGAVAAVAGAALGFEQFLSNEEKPATDGDTAYMLVGGPWKVVELTGSAEAKDAVADWCGRGDVWTFHANGKAETGKLIGDRNRYARKAKDGFRQWTWTSDGERLTMKLEGNADGLVIEYAAAQAKDDLELTAAGTEVPGLRLEKTVPVKTFPDLRAVFYAGVMAPALIAFLLAWLISRDVFYEGCLRFALGWPLTVLIGLALGAGAGYLLDVLNEHSHAAAPYWILLALAQGGIGVASGFCLAVLSSLRPT